MVAPNIATLINSPPIFDASIPTCIKRSAMPSFPLYEGANCKIAFCTSGRLINDCNCKKSPSPLLNSAPARCNCCTLSTAAGSLFATASKLFTFIK